jgi:DNA-binding ferritin-like protein
MGNSFKTIEKIAAHITSGIADLENGNLNEDALNNLLLYVQELQERLVVLRYKAYEEQADVIKRKKKKKEEKIKTVAPEIPPNQISIIDAIEKQHLVEKKVEVPKKPAFAPQVQIAVEEKVAEKAPVKRVLDQQPAFTLADKLQKSPIADLSKAIGINQKFLFINELFKQNADEFHVAIEKLNSCSDFDSAQVYLKETFFEKYSWDAEDRNVSNFLDLVERRYL